MGHSKIGLGTNKNNIADTKMHESLSKVKTIGTTSFHARPSLIVSLGPSINDVTQFLKFKTPPSPIGLWSNSRYPLLSKWVTSFMDGPLQAKRGIGKRVLPRYVGKLKWIFIKISLAVCNVIVCFQKKIWYTYFVCKTSLVWNGKCLKRFTRQFQQA